VAQVVEHLPSTCQSPEFTRQYRERKKKKKKKKPVILAQRSRAARPQVTDESQARNLVGRD
jgi:hypothetical protein